MAQLQDEINRAFGSMEHPESSSATAEWIPAVDVREYADRFELLVDLPGVDPKSVDITLDNGVLSLGGERREAGRTSSSGESSAALQQRNERRLGRFHRRFVLPDTADADNVKATGHDGVLEVSIPKQAKAKPRRITVD
jgi:HSP20 family protein